jgi:predicted dehydrogenase
MTHALQPRREFLKRAAAGGTAAFVPYFPWSQTALANLAANDRPRVGCIGLGGMGMADAHDHARLGDIVAVCDVDRNRLERARTDGGVGKGQAFAATDYRAVLDRDDVDLVSIATPDHWHVKIAIEALEAGKHVFCQKPLTLTLEENLLIRRACAKHADRVFFIGTQQRSDRAFFLRAINLVQKGMLGEIRKITAGINGGEVGGPFAKTAPPPELDWDAWLGQAPRVDYIRERCHNQFRWWYEYSGGKFTDWGAHHVDIALWAVGADVQGTGPVEIDGTDSRHPVPFAHGMPTQDDCYNTSHDFNVVCRFANGMELHVTSRGDNGITFEGTRGRLFVNRGRISGKPIEEDWDAGEYGQEDLSRLYKGKPFEGHKENFYRCLREGGLPVSDLASHLQTMHVCHLSAIAARLGRKIAWDPQAEKIMGDDEAASFFAREPRAGFEIPRV